MDNNSEQLGFMNRSEDKEIRELLSNCCECAMSTVFAGVAYADFEKNICRTVYCDNGFILPDTVTATISELSKFIMGIERIRFINNIDRENLIKKLSEDETFVFEVKNVYVNDEMTFYSVTVKKYDKSNDETYIFLLENITKKYIEEQSNEIQRRKMAAVMSQLFSSVISVNVSNDDYALVEYKNNVERNVIESGKFSEFNEKFANFVHPSFKERFKTAFSNENLTKLSENGETQYSFIFPKRMGTDANSYTWIKVTAFFVDNSFNSDILITAVAEDVDADISNEQNMNTYFACIENYFETCFLLDLSEQTCEKISSSQDIIFDENFNKKSIEEYAERYLSPDDAERFVKENLPEALLDSIKENGGFDMNREYKIQNGDRFDRYNLYYQPYTDKRTKNVKCIVGYINCEMVKRLEDDRKADDKKFLSAVSGLYIKFYQIDIKEHLFREFIIDNENNTIKSHEMAGNWRDYTEKLEQILVHPRHVDSFIEFLSDNNLEALLNGDSKELNYVYLRMNESEDRDMWVEMKLRLLCGADSSQTVMMYIRDIDAEQRERMKYIKKLNTAAEIADKANKAKTDFLSHMSHDIRTPLNAIIGMTEIAMRQEYDYDKTKDCLSKVKNSSQLLLGLVNDVFDMSKIENGAMELSKKPFKMSSAVLDTVNMILHQASEKSQSVNYDIEDFADDEVVGDEERLKQIVMNLLTNAVKFSPDGSDIELKASEISSDKEKTIFQISVRDYGCGIPKDYISRIFTPFERPANVVNAQYEGSGLGLSIVKRLLDLMGGNIVIRSDVGRGSEFVITVPFETAEIADKADEIADSDLNGEDIDFSKKRALIVEDKELNAEILRELLKPTNISIDVACNGQEAVNIIKASDDYYYDIVFMDIQMPVMNGYEATTQIRAQGGDYCNQLPIISMSANILADDRELIKLSGMTDYISKPLIISEVLKIMKKYILI